ncbi:MAG: lasso peptide biosynthesis B2 protein [Acidobacteria bacterium]|nr:lasso peptide biosynthesis B2 protein [Acidobacteriota bacterium]
MSLTHLSTRWRALSWGERRLLLGLAFLLPAVAGLVRLAGVGRARRCLERCSSVPVPRAATAVEILAGQRLALLAGMAGRRGLLRATCLRQALAVHFILRRRGLAPCLRIGVRRREGRLDAHAWVELEGVPLDPSPLDHLAFEEKPGAWKG